MRMSVKATTACHALFDAQKYASYFVYLRNRQNFYDTKRFKFPDFKLQLWIWKVMMKFTTTTTPFNDIKNSVKKFKKYLISTKLFK